MTKDLFWQMIAEARKEATHDDGMYDALMHKLTPLSNADIVRWGQMFDQYHKLSYKDSLWAAAYVINGGCSDDGFDYFRGWLIAQGKDVYLAALQNPDSLATPEVKECETELEDMLSVSADAFFEKNDMEFDYDAYDAECTKHPLAPQEVAEIQGEVIYAEEVGDWGQDEELLRKIVPRLWDMYC